jgi:hypothetical protein
MKKIDLHGRIEKPGKQVILEALLAIFLIAVGASILIAICERGVDGAKITSLTEAMWFMYATITTIGYGDITPVTDLGRTITIIAFLGSAVNLARLFSGLQKLFRDESEVDNRQIYSILAEHSRILQQLEKALTKGEKRYPSDHNIDFPIENYVVEIEGSPDEFAGVAYGADSTGDYVVSIITYFGQVNRVRWLYADSEEHAWVLSQHHLKLWEDRFKADGHKTTIVKQSH